MRYLVDGYNLAHWLLRDDDLRPQQLRAGLMRHLRQRLPQDADAVDIYWDVRKPNPSVPANEYLDWCTVHNVPDADEAIVDAVYRARSARGMCVVSRDREVTGKSKQLGAKTMSPDQFMGR